MNKSKCWEKSSTARFLRQSCGQFRWVDEQIQMDKRITGFQRVWTEKVPHPEW